METTIYKKLLSFQKKVGSIKKAATNPFFRSKYFDVNGLLEVVKPALNEYGLVLIQPLSNSEKGLVLKTMIIDSDNGEKIESEIVLPVNSDPQKMGSIITYFRRYSLQSLLSLQAEDDDGNSASGNDVKSPKLKFQGDDGGIPVASLNSKGYKGGVGMKRAPLKEDLSEEDIRRINEGIA